MVSHGEKLCTKLESLAETNTECDISEGVEGREVGGEEGGRGEGRRVGGSQSFISVFSRCSLDIICETVMGQDAGAQDDSSTPYVQARSIF